MTTTQTRLLSAFFMILIVITGFLIHPIAMKGLILTCGILLIDELSCNFLNHKRISFTYIFLQISLIVSWFILGVYYNHLINYILWPTLAVNCVLVGYLFVIPIENKLSKKLLEKCPYLILFLVIPAVVCITQFLNFDHWKSILWILLFSTFLMDTGGWFFGKNFGKNKLWKAVSPNKTIEGLLGGALLSGIVCFTLWNYLVYKLDLYMLLIFFLFGIIAQVGDLVQSKIKREFEIKDSSSLIPGHGGVYDRIDGLIFLAPFFLWFSHVQIS